MAANRHGMALAMFMSLLGWEAESTPGGTRRSQVTKALTRRDTLAMLTLALTLGPVSARALIAPATPASLALPVSDLLTFDPQVRKNADGTVVFNLAFRVDAAETNTIQEGLDAMQGRPLTELTLNWSALKGAYQLTMCSAYVYQFECAYLSRDAGKRRYDEFGLVVESTSGWLRRTNSSDAVTSAYSVTPMGALWERRTA